MQVPKGGAVSYMATHSQETNMDRLNGVHFDKGCYVGRGVAHALSTARTRPVRLWSMAAPEAGICGRGQQGSAKWAVARTALALLQLDKVSMPAGRIAVGQRHHRNAGRSRDAKLPEKQVSP